MLFCCSIISDRFHWKTDGFSVERFILRPVPPEEFLQLVEFPLEFFGHSQSFHLTPETRLGLFH